MLVKLAGDLISQMGVVGCLTIVSEALRGLEITAGHVSHVSFLFMGVGGVTHHDIKFLFFFLQTRRVQM